MVVCISMLSEPTTSNTFGDWNVHLVTCKFKYFCIPPVTTMTTKKEMTLVYYYVPEDHDDPDFPNVFGVMMPKANVRYQHIEQHFPLKGQYIFRFKVMHDNNVVWLDLQDPQSRLPTFKERIFVKATRVTWDNPELMKSPYR